MKSGLEGLIGFIGIGARLLLIRAAPSCRARRCCRAATSGEDPTEALLRRCGPTNGSKRPPSGSTPASAAAAHLPARRLPRNWRGKLDLSGVDTDTAGCAAGPSGPHEEQSLSVAPRTLTIEEQAPLRGRLGRGGCFLFNDVLGRSRDRTEVAVTLLAL
jgi:hypothetical protein